MFTTTAKEAIDLIRVLGGCGVQSVARLMINADREREALGIAICVALVKIERARGTLGRSQHARMLREHFERELAALGGGPMTTMVAEWKREAGARVDAEEAAARTVPAEGATA